MHGLRSILPLPAIRLGTSACLLHQILCHNSGGHLVHHEHRYEKNDPRVQAPSEGIQQSRRIQTGMDSFTSIEG